MPVETGLDEDREMEGRLRFETLLADLSARFINLPPESVDGAIEDAQRLVCESLGLDLSALWQWVSGAQDALILTHYYRLLDGSPVPGRMDAAEHFPWSRRQLLAGKTVIVSAIDDLPAEASIDQTSLRHFGVKTTLTIPLAAGGKAIGTISFNDARNERVWSEAFVRLVDCHGRSSISSEATAW